MKTKTIYQVELYNVMNRIWNLKYAVKTRREADELIKTGSEGRPVRIIKVTREVIREDIVIG